MPRGGKRKGAGAPKGNLNALKHGRRSRQFAELGAAIAASPAARAVLLKLAALDSATKRTADETASYILEEVLRRGLVVGRDRLIVLPDVLDGRSINELMHLVDEKNGIPSPTIDPPTRKGANNQTSDSDGNAENA